MSGPDDSARAAYDGPRGPAPHAPEPAPSDRARRAVAWIAHAPGLWLLYGQPLPPGMTRTNLLAVAATLGAMAAAVAITGRVWAAVPVWLVGHVAWGAHLVRRLFGPAPRDRRDSGGV